MSDTTLVVDLDPPVRIIGSLLGQSRSRRRGQSQDVVGSREYVPGDDVRRIDWSASARLSSVTGEERFVVREFYAEESPTVVLAIDRSPTMQLYPADLPWLHKPAAVADCLTAVTASAAHLRCLVTVATAADDVLAAPRQVTAELFHLEADRDVGMAAHEWVAPLLLEGRRWLPPGTLVFVISDFLDGADDTLVRQALDFEWDLVPVVVSDPRWERSFPQAIGGMTLPLADAAGRLRPRRISSREARRRREENEWRWQQTSSRFRDAGFPPVVVSEAGDDGVAAAFAGWSRDREAAA